MNDVYGLIQNYGNPRPYWNKDFDIGAYEIADAQFKMGAAGNLTGQAVFTITYNGTYWERDNENGQFPISSNQNYTTSECTVTTADANKENWKGWNFGWLNRGVSDLNKPIAHGFYKVHYNSDQSKFFYIDYRSAITSYSPNIYIRYNFSSQSNNKFELYNGSAFNEINNGSILRIWNIAENGSASTAGLNNYWNNCLIWIDENDYPRMIWGPLQNSGFTIEKYYLYSSTHHHSDPPGNFTKFDSVSSTTFDYLDPNAEIGSGLNSKSYEIKAKLGDPAFKSIPGESGSTNYVTVRLEDPYKIKASAEGEKLSYSLSQNYPNPFNPNTTFSFTIENDEVVEIKLFDILGREVKTILNQDLKEGSHIVNFNGSNLASGIYFYKISAGKYTAIKKLQLLK